MARGPFELLVENRTYRTYFIGQAVSLTGTWMQQVAASWVVVSLTRSTTAIATISVVASIPMLALAMPGGVFADRYDRRRILILTQFLFAAVAFGFAGLHALGHLTLPWIYALSVLLSCVMAFDFPAVQALVPDLVPPRRIPDAVALGQTLMHGTRLIGPAVAGVVMAATSPAGAFLANGLSYFAVIYSLAVITVPPRPAPSRKKGAGGLGEAFRYLGEHRTIAALIGYTALCTIFMFPLFVIFGAIFVRNLLGGGEREFGFYMSTSGLGAMTGALLLLRIRQEWRGPAIIFASLAGAAAMAVQSFSTSVAMAIAVQGVITFSIAMGMGLSSTIIQVLVPSAMRGRIMALNGMAFTGCMPASALVLGVIADGVGLRAVMRVCACAFATLAVGWLYLAGLGRRVAHTPPDADTLTA